MAKTKKRLLFLFDTKRTDSKLTDSFKVAFLLDLASVDGKQNSLCHLLLSFKCVTKAQWK